MANIPTEVVESCILPRLPVKSLVRFKSVSKSWKTLISSTNFLHLHHHHANRLLLVWQDDYTLQAHNLDSHLELPFLCPYPYPYPYNEQLPCHLKDKMAVVASCEFFILVSNWPSHVPSSLFLLHPSTLSYHKIPFEGMQRPDFFGKYRLYFDEANDDCKVLRIVDLKLNNEFVLEVEIYSCKTKLWRLIEHKLISARPWYRILFHSEACVNNLLYVIVDHPINERTRIRCFDIRVEQWTNDIVFPHKVILSDIRVVDGSLFVLGNDPSNNDNDCVWVLNESRGVKESWVKLMSNIRETRYTPIAYRKGSRHELLCRRFCDSELYWYNLRYKVATKAEFGECAQYVTLVNNVDHICKESLISFHGNERVHQLKSSPMKKVLLFGLIIVLYFSLLIIVMWTH